MECESTGGNVNMKLGYITLRWGFKKMEYKHWSPSRCWQTVHCLWSGSWKCVVTQLRHRQCTQDIIIFPCSLSHRLKY